MASLVTLGYQPKVIFPTVGLSKWGLENKSRFYYQPLFFPRWLDNEFFYTFPLIIPDPHPFNFYNAWTYKDLSERQFQILKKFFARSLAITCQKFLPNIVECQHIWLFAELVRQLKLPYICVAHHSDQLGFLLDKRMQKLAIKAAHGAKHIFAVSALVKEEVVKVYQVKPEKVKVIPNGYDQTVFKPKKVNKKKLFGQFRLPNLNLPLITFAGRLSRTKGIDVLLKANKLLQKKQPVMLVIIGAGCLEETLTDYQTAYEFKNCFFLGHQPPAVIAKFHNLAELTVVPSRSEGFGITALEAMGCGTPVVGTNTGALPEFVVGSAEIEPEDDYSLAKAVLNYLNLTAKEKELKRKQALTKAKKYSWLAMTKKRIVFYQEAAS